jgi:hypothetical protein
LSADGPTEIDRVHGLAVQMQSLADEIDDLETGAIFVDPDTVETLTYLRETCEAAERAVNRLLPRGKLPP